MEIQANASGMDLVGLRVCFSMQRRQSWIFRCRFWLHVKGEGGLQGVCPGKVWDLLHSISQMFNLGQQF